MFQAVLDAIRLAKFKLAEKNIRGDIIIELERREWNHFRGGMPTNVNLVVDFNRFDGSADSCQLEGAVVRLKK